MARIPADDRGADERRCVPLYASPALDLSCSGDAAQTPIRCIARRVRFTAADTGAADAADAADAAAAGVGATRVADDPFSAPVA